MNPSSLCFCTVCIRFHFFFFVGNYCYNPMRCHGFQCTSFCVRFLRFFLMNERIHRIRNDYLFVSNLFYFSFFCLSMFSTERERERMEPWIDVSVCTTNDDDETTTQSEMSSLSSTNAFTEQLIRKFTGPNQLE